MIFPSYHRKSVWFNICYPLKKCVVLLFLSSKKCIFAAQIFKLQDFPSNEV